MVVSDNGAKLTSNAMLSWQEDRKVDWHYIAPGKPMQNVRGALEPVSLRRSLWRASTGACGTSA